MFYACNVFVDGGRGPKINATFVCTKFFENPSNHGRLRRKSWTSAPKSLFSQPHWWGRSFLTPGHPGVRVRNVRGKSRPKSFCLCFFVPLWFTPKPENNSDHPHPPYLQKIRSQNMPYNGGLYGIKSRLKSRDFYRNMAYGPQKYGMRNPPFLCHMNRFYWGWGWSLICWKPSHNQASHPHVLSWAIVLSDGLRGISEQFRARSPEPLALKYRKGIQGSTRRITLGRSNSPKFDIRPTSFNTLKTVTSLN